MRGLIRALVLVFVVWSAYWAIAAWGLRTGLTQWFAEQERQGWQADFERIETAGYPVVHQTRLINPVLADPGTGTAWRADWLEFHSAAISPTQQKILFAPGPQRLSYFDSTLIVSADQMQVTLSLAPGAALNVETLGLASQGWHLADTQSSLMSGQSLLLTMDKTTTPALYQLRGDVTGFAPHGSLRRMLETSNSLPEQFETLSLSADVTFDTSWDRRALELRRPQPRHIKLRHAEAQWGPMRLRAVGALTLDEQGSPTGEISFQAEEWQNMIAMAEHSGALPPQTRKGVERVLALFAGMGGHPDHLEVTLTFRNGRMSLGPLPLGPAPHLLLR